MRLHSLLILLVVGACTTTSSTESFTKPEQPTRGPKNGEWIARRDDGTIKTRVNYKDGIKHGQSTLYYKDGKTAQLTIPYKAGQRHGTSVKYFEDGDLYAETNYEYDLLHGVRTTYYRSGQIKAKITYRNGYPGSDLEEYFQSGNLKEMPEIIHTREGSNLIISVDPSCSDPEFFFGGLDDDGFFARESVDSQLTPVDGQVIIDLKQYTPSYLKFQDLVCHCKSSQGNPIVIKRNISL